MYRMFSSGGGWYCSSHRVNRDISGGVTLWYRMIVVCVLVSVCVVVVIVGFDY